MHRNELDEMQLQKRNKVGNQAFMLMAYLIMADVGLYGFGFRWLEYPVNVFLIMLVCMSYYLISIIWNNAYIGPKAGNKASVKTKIYIAAITVIAAGTAMFISKSGLIKAQAPQNSDNGAIILFIFSAVSIIITILVSIISKRQNRNTDE